MNLFSLNSILVIILIITFIYITSCGNGGGESDDITIDLIEASTELPAKVRMFFQVELTENIPSRVLNESDFEIYENKLIISSLESQAKVRNGAGSYLFSSILLLDLSGSVLKGDALPRVKDASINYIQNVMPDSTDGDYRAKEMAVYWFDGEESIHVLAPFTNDKDALIDSVRSITSDISNDNSTNLNGAVIQGLIQLENRIALQTQEQSLSTAGMMVVFSDGVDQAGRATEDAAISTVKSLSSQYSVYTVGLGAGVDQGFLNKIGKDGFIFVSDSFDLNQAFLTMAQNFEKKADSYIVLEYCSLKRSGEHNVELRLIIEESIGKMTTKFDATGFTGGCIIE